MENTEKLIFELGLDKQITLEDIPGIDLYMDQVIQLFENTFASTTRNEKEKILTKTMINNYAKGKVFFPIKNKKYSREHIILISLIYQLKGGLAIQDIKETLSLLNKKIMSGDFELDSFYESYLNIYKQNMENFKQEVEKRVDFVLNEIKNCNDPDIEYLEKVLFICSFINMSNFYRKMAERIVDELSQSRENKC